MDEYIKRESIQKAMEFVTNDMTCPIHIAAYIDQIIAQESAADVVDVRHGRWVKTYGTRVSCSVCDPNKEDDQPGFFKFMKYCPNCGAKMDRGTDND